MLELNSELFYCQMCEKKISLDKGFLCWGCVFGMDKIGTDKSCECYLFLKSIKVKEDVIHLRFKDIRDFSVESSNKEIHKINKNTLEMLYKLYGNYDRGLE